MLSSGEEVRLGSRIFYTASDSLCPNSDGRYNDTKNTGSYLFSVRGDNYGQRVISTDILTDYWKSASHNCYRAHPTFIDCVQDVLSDLKTARNRAIIFSGYKAYGDLNPNTATDQEIWASAGTGVELMYEKSVTADIIGIAEVVLRHCPAKFERIQRNIGIIMGATSVHVHMTGPDDGPSFTVDGYTGLSSAAFQSWALTKIDDGLDNGLSYLACANINALSTNQVYPSGAASPEAIVGEVDEAITRDNLTDFLSCANRLVSARLNTVLHQLQINSQHYFSRSLKITKAFDEPRDSYTVTPSLHTEGRAVTVTLSSGVSSYRISQLAKYAICSNADYVRNDGLSLFIAVRKQAGETEELYDFPETELVRVLPPDSKVYQTELVDFDEATNLEYPLFDGSNQDDVILDDYATLGKFKSPSSRYLRVSPLIVKCYSALQAYYVEWENRTGHSIEVSVERAFLTTEERDILIGVDDPRYLSPVLGLSMELSLNLSLVSGGASSGYPLTSLAKLAIIKCGPIFQDGGMAMGLGIYSSMVYVDARDSFKVWNPSGSYSSSYTSVTEYNTYLTSLYSAATGNIQQSVEARGVCGTVDSESALRSVGTLLSRNIAWWTPTIQCRPVTRRTLQLYSRPLSLTHTLSTLITPRATEQTNAPQPIVSR
ncbi:protein hedgehog [Plakobranchus ocellatus]|uniref:Protein hedgehog n=1 Tax=Plakobranchus ocellatus TaxID=259542 RepID=A0AAV4BSC1_9GAST|nr:protein hedgehog [Plakobranchus ocellatus]